MLRKRDKIDHKEYKGYDLNLCWCGYPETRWMIYHGNTWLLTVMTLKQAKRWINLQLDIKTIKENGL